MRSALDLGWRRPTSLAAPVPSRHKRDMVLPSGLAVTTTQLTVSYLRPAQVGDHLVSRCELVHLGRRTASLTVRVTGRDGALVAHGTVALMVLSAPG